jgi:hypothetical protein
MCRLNQAGDMFRCKKVKGERPSPLLLPRTSSATGLHCISLTRCYKYLFFVIQIFNKAIFLQYLRL